jgi:uncharacterized membrane protein (DUF106 family)
MALELIPVLIFAWLVELTYTLQSSAVTLIYMPLFAIVWTVGVLSVMRKWEAR